MQRLHTHTHISLGGFSIIPSSYGIVFNTDYYRVRLQKYRETVKLGIQFQYRGVIKTMTACTAASTKKTEVRSESVSHKILWAYLSCHLREQNKPIDSQSLGSMRTLFMLRFPDQARCIKSVWRSLHTQAAACRCFQKAAWVGYRQRALHLYSALHRQLIKIATKTVNGCRTADKLRQFATSCLHASSVCAVLARWCTTTWSVMYGSAFGYQLTDWTPWVCIAVFSSSSMTIS